jgi:hypothetical protein
VTATRTRTRTRTRPAPALVPTLAPSRWCRCVRRQVRVWDMHSYMSIASLQVHSAAVEGMVVVPENGLLVTCSTDSTVRVWDYGCGEEVQVWRHPEEFRCVALRRTTGHVIAGTEQCHIVAFPLSEALEALEQRKLDAAMELEMAAYRLSIVETGDAVPAPS